VGSRLDERVEEIKDIAVKNGYGDDYKLFIASRVANDGIRVKYKIMLVVKVDAVNGEFMFRDFLTIKMRTNSWIESIKSEIDLRGERFVEVFTIELEDKEYA
jgi:hypothetical protein